MWVFSRAGIEDQIPEALATDEMRNFFFLFRRKTGRLVLDAYETDSNHL